MKSFSDPGVRWYVVRTNIKCEEKAAANLGLAGYHVYLPRYKVEKFNKRHNTYRVYECNLMPRYLFVGISNGDFRTARTCEGVEYIVSDEGWRGVPLRVAGKDIQAIYLAEVDFQFDDTRKAREYRGHTFELAYPVGAHVVVKLQKILNGLEVGGRIRETNGKNKIVVDLGTLGKITALPQDVTVVEG